MVHFAAVHFVVDQLLATAQAHVQAGRAPDAAALCEQVLRSQPGNPRALFMLGFLLHRAGQWQAALQRLTQAAAANPPAAEPHFLIGLIHQQQHHLPEAIAAYQQAIRLKPDDGKALNNLGRAQLDIGQTNEGIATLRRAIVAVPRNAGAHSNMGDGLRMTGDFDAAVSAQRRAIAIDPNFAEAHSNLGTALAKQGKIIEAMQSMRRAMEVNPRLATPHYNLARVLQDQGKLDEAIRHCRTAVQLRPQYPEAMNLLGNLAGITGDVTQAVTAQRRAIEIKPDHAGAHSNLLLSLHYVDDLMPEQIFLAHREWAVRHGGSPAANSTISNPANADVVNANADVAHGALNGVVGRPKLRIGYVSPNFTNHSVAYFIEPVLANHDRSAVEIFCYADVPRPDDFTGRLRGYADVWRDISGQSDTTVCDMIRGDRIDILIDLAGHTAENRMKVFAMKPAAVQMSWLGYPDTTGLATMDYRITDAIADPPGAADSLHTEKLIRIAGGCWAYQPPTDAPAVAPAPALDNGLITFGSFNNLPKVTPAVLKTWAKILLAAPNSRLIMKAMGLSSRTGRDHILHQLIANGIDANRVELLSWSPTTASHLELYHRIDLALDTFPYNGTTTTCEALWMGVPVISFGGKTHAARVGASLLTHAGLDELLANDVDDYIARTIAFAGDIAGLSHLRAGLRQRFAASSICDGARLARSLEKVFAETIAKS